MLTDNESLYVVTALRDIIDMLYRPDPSWKTEAREHIKALRDFVHERRVDAPHAHMCDCNRCAG